MRDCHQGGQMVRLVVLFIFIGTTNAFGGNVDCFKHKIYCQIVSNYKTAGKKKINKQYAMKLSNIIHKASRKYKLDSRIFTAILAQESLYNADAMKCYKGYDFVKWAENGEYVEGKICSDFGIGQIYFKTAENYKFDIHKIKYDLVYSVNASAQILGDFMKKYKRKEIHWWTRYNASSKHKREKYRQLVSRYF